MAGVRAELVVPNADRCPVAEASTDTDGPVTGIARAERANGTVVEQFTADTAVDVGKQVFDYGTQTVYEFERSNDEPCVCEVIERGVGPITGTDARDGDLHVTLHAADMTALRDILARLEEEFGQIRIEYLVRGRENAEEAEVVPVDVRKLTDRQREVLQTAHRMGYFEYPRQANAGEVGDELGIGTSTFTEHLNAAQSKLLEELRLRT
ncbi:MAG: helix-turn-helix domain-containing protein [Halovenus sp.]